MMDVPEFSVVGVFWFGGSCGGGFLEVGVGWRLICYR